jgi:hypothetical protein
VGGLCRPGTRIFYHHYIHRDMIRAKTWLNLNFPFPEQYSTRPIDWTVQIQPLEPVVPCHDLLIIVLYRGCLCDGCYRVVGAGRIMSPCHPYIPSFPFAAPI